MRTQSSEGIAWNTGRGLHPGVMVDFEMLVEVLKQRSNGTVGLARCCTPAIPRTSKLR